MFANNIPRMQLCQFRVGLGAYQHLSAQIQPVKTRDFCAVSGHALKSSAIRKYRDVESKDFRRDAP